MLVGILVSPLQALKKFFTSGVEGHAPMDDAFVQIDRERLIANLALLDRGAERGALNLPGPDETSLDIVETEVISHIGDQLNSAQINVRNHTQSYENRLSDLQLLHELGSIRAATKKATGDFETLVIDWRNRLSNRRDAIRESYVDLQTFKADHSLDRPTHEVPSKVVTFGSIAVAGLFEVFGNAIFLRVNDDLGYLGGIVAAIMVAAVNIGIASAVGYFLWPRTHLRESASRTIAWIGIALWLFIVGIWNLFAAHYRDAKSLGFEDPQSAAGQLLISQPFGLDGIYSWGLFIIGIIAALVAARSAYRMDDPYPGYGDRGRQHRQRCEEYAEEVAKANRALTGVRDDAIGDAQEVKRQLGVQFRERERIEAAYSRFVKRFEQHQDLLEQTANALLSVYRETNRQARTEPAPIYFADRYVLPRHQIEPLHRPTVRADDIMEAEGALTECIDEVDAAFRQSVLQFEPLDVLKAKLERGTI